MKALTNQELQEIVDEIPIVVLHNIGAYITNLRNENWKLEKNYKRNRTINEKLRKRINKAIEYIEYYIAKGKTKNHKQFDTSVLDILKGVDKE